MKNLYLAHMKTETINVLEFEITVSTIISVAAIISSAVTLVLLHRLTGQRAKMDPLIKKGNGRIKSSSYKKIPSSGQPGENALHSYEYPVFELAIQCTGRMQISVKDVAVYDKRKNKFYPLNRVDTFDVRQADFFKKEREKWQKKLRDQISNDWSPVTPEGGTRAENIDKLLSKEIDEHGKHCRSAVTRIEKGIISPGLSKVSRLSSLYLSGFMKKKEIDSKKAHLAVLFEARKPLKDKKTLQQRMKEAEKELE